MSNINENSTVYMEEIKMSKDFVQSVNELLEKGSFSEENQNLLKLLEKQANRIKKAICDFKRCLLQASNAEKEKLVFVACNFIQELTLYMKDWSSLLEKHFTGSSSHSPIVFHLLKNAIHDIAEVLCHCKESTTIYERCFLEVSTSLSNLFKSTYQTLKVILDDLGKTNLEQSNQKAISEYANCIMQLFDVSLILKDIDMMPLGNTLRCLNRIISNKKHLLHEELDGTQIFNVVCLCILDKLAFCWSLIEETALQNQIDPKRLSKVLKVLRYLLGMLLQLVKSYKNEIYGKATQCIVDVLVLLQWMTPKTVHKKLLENQSYKEFCSSVLIVIEPLLMELISERDFIEKFLRIEGPKGDDQSGRHYLSLLQLFVSIASLLAKGKDEANEEWIKEIKTSSRQSLVEIAFQLYEKCQERGLESVMIPMSVEIERPLRNTTLHEYVCIGLCAYAAVLKQSNFEKLERCLLRYLMVSKSLHILSADLLSFIARWGPESVCLQLTDFFAHLSLALFKQLPLNSEPLNRSLSMMQRLFLLLGDIKKEHFLRNCIAASRDCMPLWISLPIANLNEQSFKKYIGLVINATLEGLEEYETNGQRKMMMMTFKVWENCLNKDKALQFLSLVQRNGLKNVITEVFLNFKNSDCEEIDEQFTCLLLGVTSNIICTFEQRQIQEILHITHQLLQCNTSCILSIKVSQLLSALKSVHFETEYERCCLSFVSNLFNILLQHQSFFVQLEAMKTLKAFAEVTHHSEVIPDCLPACANEAFKDFLNNDRLLGEISTADQEERMRMTLKSLAENRIKPEACEDERGSIPSSPVFDFNQEELQAMETNLKSAVHAIKEYLQEKHIPGQILTRLKNIVQDIVQLDTLKTSLS